LSLSGLAIALVLLLFVNILGSTALGSLRFDLTADKLYTLSDGAKRILSKLEEPVTLRYYFSRKLAADLPQIVSYANRVEELLGEFESRSGGKLKLNVADPEPFSEIEDRAVGFGLRGVQVGAGELLYFGLVGTNSTDDTEIIPFFQPDKEEFLEYELAKLVYTLTTPTKQVLGVLSTIPIEGDMPSALMPNAGMSAPWFIMDQLRKIYELRSIRPGAEEIPEDVDLLMLVHPKGLGDKLLYAIDQFALSGKGVLVFVDPFCEADRPPPDPSNPMAQYTADRSSDLPELFAAWGVSMKEGQLAGDRISAIKVPVPDRGREEAVPFVVYLALDSDRLDPKEVVTSRLGEINVGMAGILEPVADATTEFTPLVKTSAESMDVATTSVQFQANPKELLANFFSDGKDRTIVARVSGPAKTAFPEGRPLAPDEEDPSMVLPDDNETPHVEKSEGINVMVVADADMLNDRFWVQVQNLGSMRLGMPYADNGSLVTNSLEFLQGSTDLISLRGRSGSKRPFKVVENLELKAEQRFRAEERQLTSRLEEAERRINELQSTKEDGSSLILSPEQQREIERIREEQVKTRKELRNVRHELRKDIESLGTKLKFLNIGLTPILIGLLALGLGTYKANRRKSP
jgi:ABC-type uncharacterized transport system involved in gliding motility auxiliary subunit